MNEIQGRTGRMGQIRIYFGKQLRIFLNNRDWKVLPLAAMIAWMVSYVTGDRMYVNMEGTRTGAFAIVCVCIWNGFFNSIQLVCRERAIIKREHRAGLYISAYIVAHMLFQMLLCTAQVLVCIGVFRACGMRFPAESGVTGSYYLDLGLSMLLITYTADMMSLMVSCFVKTTTTAMTVMPFLLIFQLIFSGVIFDMNEGAMAFLSKLTISRWGTNVICAISGYNSMPSQSMFNALWMFRSDPFVKQILDEINASNLRWQLDMGTAVYMQRTEYSLTLGNVYRQWGILLGFAALYVLAGILLLNRIDKDRR